MHPDKKRRIATALPAALLLVLNMLMSLASHAAALGDELILSQLGDPVEVEIAVMQWEDIDLDQLQISAGTPEVYESFGLDYLPALESLSFNLIGPNLDGEVKVLVSSREPMHEPYLELLLVMRWPGGSLLREYVLLFDPPRASQATPPASPPVAPQPPVTSAAPVPVVQPEIAVAPQREPDLVAEDRSEEDQNSDADVQPSAQEAEQVAVQPAVQQEAAAAEETVTIREIEEPVAVSDVDGAVIVVEAEEASRPVDTGPAAVREGSTYRVESGDNLWGIASRFGPPNADLYQILLSLYELNRGSFINGNISLLKYGVTLRLPTAADIAEIDPATAKSLFDQRWNEGAERIEMAERGEPLPPLSSIFEPVIVRPEINPTAPLQEDIEALPAATDSAVPGIAANSPLAPAPAAGPAQGQAAVPALAGAGGIAVLPAGPAANNAGAPIAPAPAGTDATASTNPYLNDVNTSVQFMQEMLNAKQQQVELLEAQMAEMNTRMLEISRVTERLNTSLDEALAQRARQQDSDRRNTILLGGLVVVLSIAVIAIIMMVLKLAAQIRLQHELLQSAMQTRQLMATAKATAATATSERPKSLPENVKTARAQKHATSEYALSVPIIEEEEVSYSGPPQDGDNDPASNAAREALDAQLGDMELEHPSQSESSESK